MTSITVKRPHAPLQPTRVAQHNQANQAAGMANHAIPAYSWRNGLEATGYEALALGLSALAFATAALRRVSSSAASIHASAHESLVDLQRGANTNFVQAHNSRPLINDHSDYSLASTVEQASAHLRVWALGHIVVASANFGNLLHSAHQQIAEARHDLDHEASVMSARAATIDANHPTHP